MELPYSIFPPHSWFVVCCSKWLRRGSGFVVRRLIVSHGSSYPIHFCTLGHFFFDWHWYEYRRWENSLSLWPFLQQLRNCKIYIFPFPYFSTVPGNWSSWGDWSPCSKTCGNGTVTRTRSCDNPAPAHGGTDCVGEANMTQDCFVQLCPGRLDWTRSLQYLTEQKYNSELMSIVLVVVSDGFDWNCQSKDRRWINIWFVAIL